MSTETSPTTPAPAPDSSPRRSRARSTYVVGALTATLGLIVWLIGMAVFASTNGTWPVSPSYLESQATNWTVGAWLMITGLLALDAGVVLVIAALRPKQTVVRQAPLALLPLALALFVTGRWIANSVFNWVNEATSGRFSSEAWDIVATPDYLSVRVTVAGILLVLISVGWLIVRAIRLGAQKVAATG